ncbi:SusC/RagA family TonB-linked outer membrane protein [Bacteroidota bacterium]
MKKLITSLIICLFFINQAFSQRTVTGHVISDDQPSGLAGALVQIKGQLDKSITDNSGNFSLLIPEDGGLLIISLSGYRTEEIEINLQKTVDVQLAKLPERTDEISIGYGTQSKEELTGSVSQIDAESIGSQPLIDLEQANQGRASGVFIQNNGGKLGQGTTVKIRGGSSLTGSNSPLYVVDGVPLTSNNQTEINPNNIASIEVLKDASAAVIYGSRAANGVILITTKKGEAGKLKVDFDYQLGVSQTPKKLDLMSPKDYNEMFVEYTLRFIGYDEVITRSDLETWAQNGEAVFNDPSDPATEIRIEMPLVEDLSYDTDWQDEVFRTALSHRSNINLSGGSENHRFFTGIGYTTQEGILIGNDYNRLNADLNLNSQFTKQLSVNFGLSFIHSKNNRLNEDQDLGSPLQAIVLPPSDSYDPDNEYRLFVRSLEYNPMTEVYYSDNVETNNRVVGNLGAKYRLNENLSLNVDGGIDVLDFTTEKRQGPETLEGKPSGLSRIGETSVFNYIVNGYADYTNSFGNNNLSAVLGASYQRSNSDFSFKRARVNSIGEIENDPDIYNPPIPSSGFAFLSYFTRINYSIQKKYIFQVSGRLDGSSKFGDDNRYGFFPAVSAGWNLSNESFLSGSSTISFLKLKGSYGLVGNTPDEDFIYRTNYFIINYGTEEGIRLSNLSNSKLKWETTAQLDVGVEFGFLADKISGSVNYFQKNTTDLLLPVPVSQTSGFDFILQNVGSLENSGIEVDINTSNIESDNFRWHTSFNFSTINNEITKLGGEDRKLISGVNAYLEGKAPGVFYMPVYEGVNSLNGEAEYSVGSGGITTDYDEALANGRQIVGDPNPDFFGGLSNTLSFFNFDLDFLFQFVQGADKYNQTGEFLANSGILLLGQRADQVDRWIEPGEDSQFSVIKPSAENTNPSTRWLEDGSYIRLNNVSLTYNLPIDIVRNWGMRYFRIYVGGQNLLTITDYSGYDPDTYYIDPTGGTITQNINRGIDDFTTPQPRTIITGIKIGF